MKIFKVLVFSIITAVLLNACGATYPSDKLVESLEKLVKKESGAESTGFLAGQTLYLDMELKGLASQDPAEANDAVKKMQGAIFAITRVVLSTDADTKFMVVSSFDPGRNVLFRIVQSIDDVKSYLYSRISRGDYETRNLMEIEGPDTASASIEDKHDISINEYVARMIISQINMTSRSNPFFGAMISSLQLRYVSFEEGILTLSMSNEIDEKLEIIIKQLVEQQAKIYAEKYKIDISLVKLINAKGSRIIEVPLK